MQPLSVLAEPCQDRALTDGALPSHVRLRKRGAKATDFRNRLHIFDACNGIIATERAQYTQSY